MHFPQKSSSTRMNQILKFMEPFEDPKSPNPSRKRNMKQLKTIANIFAKSIRLAISYINPHVTRLTLSGIRVTQEIHPLLCKHI